MEERGMKLMGAIAAAALLAGAHAVAAQSAPEGDAAKGAKTAKICKTCHRFGPGAVNAIGPVLNGIVGRKAGTYPGYNYSEANKTSGITWTEANLKTYLKAPQKMVPGTKMTFAGFEKQSDIDNVVAFLKTLGPDGNPIEK
jgi:cytochrome c